MITSINGRKTFLNCDKLDVIETGAGRFTADYGRSTFDVIGGTKSGGAANEWFVRNVEFLGDAWHPVASKVAAIKFGIQH